MDQLSNKLIELVEALERAAPEVWRIAVAQARLEGIIALFWVVGGIIALFGMVWCVAIIRRARDERDLGGLEVVIFVVGILSFVLILVGASQLSLALTGLFNPEWLAIDLLLDKLQ